jgi:hypothetical protein
VIGALTFRPDNKVWYRQGIVYHRNVPADVRFQVVIIRRSGIWLRAPNYGMSPYGDGVLYVPFRQEPFQGVE